MSAFPKLITNDYQFHNFAITDNPFSDNPNLSCHMWQRNCHVEKLLGVSAALGYFIICKIKYHAGTLGAYPYIYIYVYILMYIHKTLPPQLSVNNAKMNI